MRVKAFISLPIAIVATVSASVLWAGPWEGTVKLGGIYLDEVGDLSAVQETYNTYDGFSISRLKLKGTPNPNHYFMLDLNEVNLDSRKGRLLYRAPGTVKLTASYDQHRQVFDPNRSINSKRRDWHFGADVTPARWLALRGSYNHQSRTGDRQSFPLGTVSVLGTQYNSVLQSGFLSAEVRKNRRGFALDYRVSDYNDKANVVANRTGQVVSARLFASGFLFDNMTHLVRGAYGVSELSETDLDYTLANLQYTGVLRPSTSFQFKYRFNGQRIDNKSTRLKTDRFQNDFDATYFHGRGNVSAGYGYELNDDDRRLTDYHSWRAAATLRDRVYTARLRYAGRVKKDTEKLTLLENVEATRFMGDLELRPDTTFAFGGGFNFRNREFPDIRVESEGLVVRGNARYTRSGEGGLSATYTYSKDDFLDLAGSYKTRSHIITARLDFTKIRRLLLAGGVTYLDIGGDLDIEKSILFFETMYSVRDDLHLEVKYNVYNYDDYLLRDRYYTANVVWFNVAYDLHVE